MTSPVRDAGQAFPIYITVVAGLLFLALAYLAVGQAAVNRSSAQTAADAAALAAAQKTRDQLAGLWLANVRDPAKWQAIFAGDGGGDFCLRADRLAALNGATEHCAPDGPLSYVVEATTIKGVGHSVVPGIEDKRSTAHATAVIEPLCTPPPDEGTEGAVGADPPALTCKDHKVWHPKPDDSTSLPKPEDLFDVHLADSPAHEQ
ncbi:pilus assembly protein TadG-related protein [Streptomyces filipinensis]|uniref:pilus assembly protein TadG-related protein n=1 Tax=Streptomyces filipinensis TaxID=66887 RepID=UPI0036F02A99